MSYHWPHDRHGGLISSSQLSLYEVGQGIDLGRGACDRGNSVGVDAVQVACEVGGSLRRNNAKASATGDSELEVFIEGLGEVVPVNLELNV